MAIKLPPTVTHPTAPAAQPVTLVAHPVTGMPIHPVTGGPVLPSGHPLPGAPITPVLHPVTGVPIHPVTGKPIAPGTPTIHPVTGKPIHPVTGKPLLPIQSPHDVETGIVALGGSAAHPVPWRGEQAGLAAEQYQQLIDNPSLLYRPNDPGHASAKSQWGTLLNLNSATNIQAEIDTEELDHDEDMCLQIAIPQLFPLASMEYNAISIWNSNGFIAVTLEWRTAHATFANLNKKVLYPIGYRVRRIPFKGAQARVIVTWGNPSAEGGLNTQVMVAVTRNVRNEIPDEWQCPVWIPTAAAQQLGTLYGSGTYVLSQPFDQPQSLVPQPMAYNRGLLLGTRCYIDSMPTGAGASKCYVQLFDLDWQGSGPTTGSFPLWQSKPLLGVGDWDSFSDELGAGGLEWGYGLWVALSSTPGTYTAVGSGASFGCDVKQGS